MKKAYKSNIEWFKIYKCRKIQVMCSFRLIEYKDMYIVIFTVMFTFVLFAIYFWSAKYLFLVWLTESELNKANKYICF